MGLINIGNQKITFQAEFPSYGNEFNKLIHKIIPKGLYWGGEISVGSDNRSIDIQPMVLVMEDTGSGLSARMQTGLVVNVPVTTGNNVVIARWSYHATEEWFVDFINLDNASVLPDDHIVWVGNPNVTPITTTSVHKLIKVIDPNVLSANQYNAITSAESPSGTNPFVTESQMSDFGIGKHNNLTEIDGGQSAPSKEYYHVNNNQYKAIVNSENPSETNPLVSKSLLYNTPLKNMGDVESYDPASIVNNAVLLWDATERIWRVQSSYQNESGWQGRLIVAPLGGDYSDIQKALQFVESSSFTSCEILVAPGEYTMTLDMFQVTKNYKIRGVGRREDVILKYKNISNNSVMQMFGNIEFENLNMNIYKDLINDYVDFTLEYSQAYTVSYNNVSLLCSLVYNPPSSTTNQQSIWRGINFTDENHGASVIFKNCIIESCNINLYKAEVYNTKISAINRSYFYNSGQMGWDRNSFNIKILKADNLNIINVVGTGGSNNVDIDECLNSKINLMGRLMFYSPYPTPNGTFTYTGSEIVSTGKYINCNLLAGYASGGSFAAGGSIYQGNYYICGFYSRPELNGITGVSVYCYAIDENISGSNDKLVTFGAKGDFTKLKDLYVFVNGEHNYKKIVVELLDSSVSFLDTDNTFNIEVPVHVEFKGIYPKTTIVGNISSTFPSGFQARQGGKLTFWNVDLSASNASATFTLAVLDSISSIEVYDSTLACTHVLGGKFFNSNIIIPNNSSGVSVTNIIAYNTTISNTDNINTHISGNFTDCVFQTSDFFNAALIIDGNVTQSAINCPVTGSSALFIRCNFSGTYGNAIPRNQKIGCTPDGSGGDTSSVIEDRQFICNSENGLNTLLGLISPTETTTILFKYGTGGYAPELLPAIGINTQKTNLRLHGYPAKNNNLPVHKIIYGDSSDYCTISTGVDKSVYIEHLLFQSNRSLGFTVGLCYDSLSHVNGDIIIFSSAFLAQTGLNVNFQGIYSTLDKCIFNVSAVGAGQASLGLAFYGDTQEHTFLDCNFIALDSMSLNLIGSAVNPGRVIFRNCIFITNSVSVTGTDFTPTFYNCAFSSQAVLDAIPANWKRGCYTIAGA